MSYKIYFFIIIISIIYFAIKSLLQFYVIYLIHFFVKLIFEALQNLFMV